MWDFITRNWEAFVIGAVFFVLSTIVALLIKNRKKISLKYLMRTNNLIKGKENSDIKVTFKGIDAPNVTVTKILIWNNGNQRLNKEEITRNNPITISIDEKYKILDILVIKVSNKNSEFDFQSISTSSYVLHFEYMNPMQGCVIQVVHTAPNEDSISLHCELKNGKKILKPVIKKIESTEQNIISLVIHRRNTFFLCYTFF